MTRAGSNRKQCSLNSDLSVSPLPCIQFRQLLYYAVDGDFDSSASAQLLSDRSIGWRRRRWCEVENIRDIRNAIIHHCPSPPLSFWILMQIQYKILSLAAFRILFSWAKTSAYFRISSWKTLLMTDLIFTTGPVPLPFLPPRMGAWMCIRNMAWRMRGGRGKIRPLNHGPSLSLSMSLRETAFASRGYLS